MHQNFKKSIAHIRGAYDHLIVWSVIRILAWRIPSWMKEFALSIRFIFETRLRTRPKILHQRIFGDHADSRTTDDGAN